MQVDSKEDTVAWRIAHIKKEALLRKAPWQGRRDSNTQPAVLETAALPLSHSPKSCDFAYYKADGGLSQTKNMDKYKLGIIGAGNMSTAITGGVLRSKLLLPSEILVSDVSYDRLDRAKALGVDVCIDNAYLAEHCEHILFAVKPQSFPEIATSLKGKLSSVVILSIMAGIGIDTLKTSLDVKSVCRIMPNTPCMVGYGMSALCFDGCSAASKDFALKIFSSMGEVVVLDEKKFDAVTSVSGSGPAYVYMFIQGMIKGGMNGGLSFEEAKKLTLATMIGGTKMIESSERSIDELIDAVCSKGGTTIQAVTHYRNEHLTEIIAEGVDRCRARSIEMSHPNGETTQVRIYTDGACSGNPGPGGYCAILLCNGAEKVISGGEDNTTNNRMELLAVIEGLKSLTKRCVVEVYSDSAYVVNAINNGWIHGWAARGWENVKNPDLWYALYNLLSCHDVRFVKVKGHSTDAINNRCDEIARKESLSVRGE